MSVFETVDSKEFDQFGLHESVMRGVAAAGFKTPRAIQLETIPAALEGQDVLGLAQTGTGKTAAFALPLLDRLVRVSKRGPRVLVLAPTRELATQIAEEIDLLAQSTRIQTVKIYGGVSISSQSKLLRRGPEIVVGCPGRVLDLMGQGMLLLNQVETLVLDEADHMFDMGFLPDIKRILKALPRQRQNLLFSATMPRELRGLADEVLNRPHVVDLAGRTPASTIDHALLLVSEDRKKDLLMHMLKGRDCDSAIVFTRTKHRAKRLADQLSVAGHKAVGLQGNMSQPQRDRAMDGFRARRFDVLVATDIAARGIDVSGVSYVINFDVPNSPEAYTHRIGRTGRAELDGIARTFVTNRDEGWVRSTERMIGTPIPRQKVDGFDPGVDATAERSDRRYPPSNGSRRRYSPANGARRNAPGNRGERRTAPSAGRGERSASLPGEVRGKGADDRGAAPAGNFRSKRDSAGGRNRPRRRG